MKPTKSILDRSFPYTPSHKTNVKETIERVRRQLQEERGRQSQEMRSKTLTFRKAR